jgi:hypothetical protein
MLHSELPDELGMLLTRKQLGESIGYHSRGNHSFNGDLSLLHFLSPPMLADVNMSELGLQWRRYASQKTNCLLVIAFESDRVTWIEHNLLEDSQPHA